MQIVGEWLVCPDGVTRPVVPVKFFHAAGNVVIERFLVDSAADSTALSAGLLNALQLPSQPASGIIVRGIGGQSPAVVVTTRLEFTRDDGGPAGVSGTFAAFTDPAATDLCILGRDVLDLFDVIVSRRRDHVRLLAGNHQYQIVP